MDKIKNLEKAGWKHLANNEYAKALEIFNEIHTLDAKNIAAIQGRIACYRKKCNYNTAMTLIEEGLAAHPSEPGILSEMAWVYIEQAKYDEAIKVFAEYLKYKQDDPGIYLWQLYLLRRQCSYSEAAVLLVEAKALFPSNTGFAIEEGWLNFYQLQFDDSIEIFNTVLTRDPLNEMAFQGKIACLRKQGFYSEALGLANKALHLLQTSPGIYSERGWINLETGDFDEAEKDFKKVISVVDNDPYAHINLAWALIKQDSASNLAEAIEHCKYALNLRPDLSEAFGCMGNIFYKQGNVHSAESYFIRAINSDSVRGPYSDLAGLYIQMERYDEAKEMLDKAVQKNVGNIHVHLEMGSLYLHTGKIKDAIREYKRVTMIEPNNPEGFRALGIALTENKDLIEAEKVLRSAIKLFDESKRYGLHLALAQLLILSGDQTGNSPFYGEALKEVHNAIHIKPDDATCYFLSGIIRFKLEDYGNALKNFKDCLRQDDKFIEAELNANRIREMIKQERKQLKSSRFASFFLTAIFLFQLIFAWFLYFRTTKITPAMISVLVPVLSGLLILSILLPWLNRFKLSGIEAELSDPKPKDSLASGPKGEMLISNSLRKAF